MTTSSTKPTGSLSGRLGSRSSNESASASEYAPRPFLTIVAMVALLAAMLGLVSDTGGLFMNYTPYVCALMLPSLWVLVKEFTRWPVSVRVSSSLLVGWTLISFLYAPVRSQFPATMLILFGLFPVAASASYLMRFRRKHLFAVLIATGAIWLFESFKVWLVILAPSQPRLLRTVGWHNPTAAFFGMLSLCALAVALRTTKQTLRYFASACLGLGTGLIYLTGSRGGQLVFALSVLVALLALRPRLLTMISTGAFSLGVAASTYELFWFIAPAARVGGAAPAGDVSPSLGGHLASASGDFGLRVQYWHSAVQMFLAHPIFGVGPGSWVDVSWRYLSPTEDWSTAAHNWYLQTFAETGLIGGLALVVMVAVISVYATRVLFDRNASALARGASGAVLLMTAYNFIDFNNRWPIVMWTLALMTGIVAGSRPLRPVKEAGRILSVLPFLALLGLFGIGFSFGIQSSNLFGRPFGVHEENNIQDTLLVANTLLDTKVNGQPAPQYKAAYTIINKSLHWSPNEPRLSLMRDVILFDVDPTEQSVNYVQLYEEVTHQQLTPWAASFTFVSTALSNRATAMQNAPVVSAQTHRTIAQMWAFDYLTARYGTTVFATHPGWDPGYVQSESLYALQLQALNVLSPCGHDQMAIIKGLQMIEKNGAVAAVKGAKNMLHQIAQPRSLGGCPNLAKLAGLK